METKNIFLLIATGFVFYWMADLLWGKKVWKLIFAVRLWVRRNTGVSWCLVGVAILSVAGYWLGAYVVEHNEKSDKCASACQKISYEGGELDEADECVCLEKKVYGVCSDFCLSSSNGYYDTGELDDHNVCTCVHRVYLDEVK